MINVHILWILETISLIWLPTKASNFPSPQKVSLSPFHQSPFLRDNGFLISITIEFFCLCLDYIQIRSFNILFFVSPLTQCFKAYTWCCIYSFLLWSSTIYMTIPYFNCLFYWWRFVAFSFWPPWIRLLWTFYRFVINICPHT